MTELARGMLAEAEVAGFKSSNLALDKLGTLGLKLLDWSVELSRRLSNGKGLMESFDDNILP